MTCECYCRAQPVACCLSWEVRKVWTPPVTQQCPPSVPMRPGAQWTTQHDPKVHTHIGHTSSSSYLEYHPQPSPKGEAKTLSTYNLIFTICLFQVSVSNVHLQYCSYRRKYILKAIWIFTKDLQLNHTIDKLFLYYYDE